MSSTYNWRGQDEHILRFGEITHPQIIVIQPFFEEGNRIRQIIVAIMREISEAGFCVALPDLPGTGESSHALDTVDLANWRSALSAASATLKPFLAVSFRSGCLIDDATNIVNLWRCAPETGARLVRDLQRTRLTGGQNDEEAAGYVTLAGNRMKSHLVDALAAAEPSQSGNIRTARLSTDAAEADVRLDGSPVWRRSEPGDDPFLRASILADLIPWAKKCAES